MDRSLEGCDEGGVMTQESCAIEDLEKVEALAPSLEEELPGPSSGPSATVPLSAHVAQQVSAL